MSTANQHRPMMPSVLDREVRDIEGDAFGHAHFAEALRSLLEADANKPPFSVGLLGSWGTGKSSIKELYLTGLRNDRHNGAGRTRADRFHAITFNAWRYGGENIKRALLRHVFLALGGDEDELRRELYQQVQHSTTTAKGWWQWIKEAVLQNVVSVALFVLLLGLVLLLAWWFARAIGLTDQLGLSALATVALATAGFLAKYVVDIRLKSPMLFNPSTTVHFPSTSAEEYELLLLQQLRRFRVNKTGRHCERLIIFIDDLDRLSATEMVAGLDAIRTFLELPREALPAGLGVIFVISCDEDRVAEALARGRGRLGASDLPGSVFNRSDARRYLDRLFQFRLEIPRFPKRDMRRFALEKMVEMGPLNKALEQRGIRPEEVIDRLIHVGVRNPRNAIQLLNAFAQSWWIASERERDGVGSDQPGVLHDKAVTEHPLSLAAISVLRVDFPDFFGRLQGRPQLIDEFSSAVFGTADPSEFPDQAREALSDILATDKEGNLQKEVNRYHGGLRQYLASLRGMRWPKRLQPLLLLSEDAVTRRYGPRAAELHDAFVSGDTQGVLEVFGRQLDEKPLTVDDVRLLEDLSEAVAQDSETRRISGARVLAALAHRIPDEHARSIMTPLARQLIDLKQVRMSVGPNSAFSVLKHCSKNDQREVAARYCEDLLLDKPIEYQLPTGESPNLEELAQIVTAACELALAVRKEYGLPSAADTALTNWLLTRHVRVGEDSTSLPFAKLDCWVAKDEDALLSGLADRYSNLAVAEFEADNLKNVEPRELLRRIRLVHDRLAAVGEESREAMWGQLSRLVAVHNADAASAAWETAAHHADLQTPQQTSFAAAMAARLKKELDDDEKWPLDRKVGAEQLVDLLGQWNSHLDERAVQTVTELIAAWAEFEETAGLAAKSFLLLQTEHSEAAVGLLDAWSDVPFGLDSLGWQARRLVATQAAQLADQQRANIVKHLDQVVNADDVPELAAKEYTRFVETVPQQAWGPKLLRAHVDRFFARVESMFQDQNGYLTRLFPAARSLLDCGPDGRAGTMLQTLFDQAAGVPPTYVLLHELMKGHWPKPDKKVGQYGPEQIFDRAVQFVDQHQSLKDIGSVLVSLADMKRKGVVPNEKGGTLAHTAVGLWPHQPTAVREAVDAFAQHLTADDVGALILQAGPSADEPEGDLSIVLEHARMHIDAEGETAVARRILNEPPKGVDDEPDWALATWFEKPAKHRALTMASLLTANELNDSQRERLFRRAIVYRSELGFAFFVDTVPKLLADANLTKTRVSILDSNKEIGALAAGADERTKLSRELIGVLPNAPGDDQARIARWIRELGGQATLEASSKMIEELGVPGLEVIVKEFPESRKLKKRLDRLHKEQNT